MPGSEHGGSATLLEHLRRAGPDDQQRVHVDGRCVEAGQRRDAQLLAGPADAAPDDDRRVRRAVPQHQVPDGADLPGAGAGRRVYKASTRSAAAAAATRPAMTCHGFSRSDRLITQ